jgi:hypothetical protein
VALFRPDDTYIKTFGITNATGAAVNADGTPAGSLLRNGAVDGTVTVAVAGVSGQAGIYAATGGKVAATLAAGDVATDAISAATLATDAVAEIQSGLATAATQTTILVRLGAFTGSGVNTVLGFFRALLSKTATTPSDVGGTFDPATDSAEAIRDRGDAAWVTGTGGGGSTDLPAIELIGTIAASPTPTTTAITVDLDEPLDAEIAAADLAGTYCTVDGRGPKGRLVATATIGSGRTGVVLTFAAGAFAAGAAQAGDRVTITG